MTFFCFSPLYDIIECFEVLSDFCVLQVCVCVHAKSANISGLPCSCCCIQYLKKKKVFLFAWFWPCSVWRKKKPNFCQKLPLSATDILHSLLFATIKQANNQLKNQRRFFSVAKDSYITIHNLPTKPKIPDRVHINTITTKSRVTLTK